MTDEPQEAPPPPNLPPPPDQRPPSPPPSQLPDGGSPRRSRTPIVIMGVVTVVAVLALAGVLVYKFASQPSTTSRPLTPVAEAALEGLLLSPDQINTAVGATAMTVKGTETVMGDISAHVSDQACLPLQSPFEVHGLCRQRVERRALAGARGDTGSSCRSECGVVFLPA